MLTPPEIKKVHEVMTACNGDRQKAAEILCMSRADLGTTISKCEALNQVWKKNRTKAPEAPTAVELYKGPALQILNPESAEEQEQRLDQEFEKLMAGQGGVSADLLAARSLQKAYGKHLGRCMDLMGGNLVDQAMRLNKLVKERQHLIENPPDCMDEIAVMKYSADLNFHSQCIDSLVKILDMATKSNLARAKIKALEGGKDSGKPKGKPGFGPKTSVNVQESKPI